MGVVAMASGASRTGMPADQGIIGERVIEPWPRKPDQAKGAPAMIAVASLAGLAPRVRFAVKPGISADIGRYPTMTPKAFSVLRLT
jgi:hypothetical protein